MFSSALGPPFSEEQPGPGTLAEVVYADRLSENCQKVATSCDG